eukprot:scaffold11763_cov19-Tisochrysis_lutea.AAC.1
MERIPRPGSRDAVFFMHGVLDTSMAWVSAGNNRTCKCQVYDGHVAALGRQTCLTCPWVGCLQGTTSWSSVTGHACSTPLPMCCLPSGSTLKGDQHTAHADILIRDVEFQVLCVHEAALAPVHSSEVPLGLLSPSVDLLYPFPRLSQLFFHICTATTKLPIHISSECRCFGWGDRISSLCCMGC